MPLAVLGAVLVFGIPTAKSAISVDKPSQVAADPMALVTSPNEPLMIEAIRYATARRADDGPWGGDQRQQGPTATFPIPGGTITLTRDQIAEANFVYPQLKERARNGRPYSGGGGPAAASFSDGEVGEWSDKAR